MRTLIALFIMIFSFSANAQNASEVMQERNPDSIHLILKKNQKIEKIYLIDQFDYVLSSDSYDMTKTETLSINFSASLVNQIDNSFLAWVKGDPTKWSGTLQVYDDGKKTPAITLEFKQSKITSFSQSLSQTRPLENTIFFTSKLKEIKINGIEM